MLVLTRRAGEAIYIGDDIEVFIVEVDALDATTRCAISVCDEAGNDEHLRHAKLQTGVTVIRRTERSD